MLRQKGVVGKFVEFYGPGLGNLSLEDQATIANMAPEYGATCGFFPTSKETLEYLTGTGRAKAQVDLVEKYAKTQGMFRTKSSEDPVFSSTLELDLGDVVPALAGPKRPQDRVILSEASEKFTEALADIAGGPKSKAAPAKSGAEARMVAEGAGQADHHTRKYKVNDANFEIGHGDVVIAAITSCTNTSNPSRDDRRRPAGAQCQQVRPEGQAVGQDLAGPGQPGGDRVSEVGRPAEGPGQAGL
jgi:aconitate hydratase